MLFVANAARAETVVVAGTRFPHSLGNVFAAVGQPSTIVWTAVFDTLTRFDEQGELQPALALSWRTVTPTTWVFELRPDVVFQNGAAFNAQTVVDIIELLRASGSERFYVASEIEGISGVRALDELTLEVRTKHPDAILPKRFNMIFIVDPGEWAELGVNGFAQKPVGTGPYRVTDWGQTSGRLLLEAHPESWRGPGEVDRVEILQLIDVSTRVQALLSGQVDIALALGPDELAQLDDRLFRILPQRLPQIMSIALRNVREDDSPLKDKRVRQALNYAINKRQIIATILGGKAKPATQGTTAETFGFNPDLPGYSYDPDRARALLDNAGYTDGFSLNLQVTTGLLPSDGVIFQAVAQNLADIGVDATIYTPPFTNWATKYFSGRWGEIDTFSFIWDSGAYYDAIRPIRNYSCAKVNPFFCDTEVMDEIAATYTEMDPSVREHKLQSVMARVYDLAPAIWLLEVSNAIAISSRINRLELNHWGLRFETLTIE